jgi:hypothetical protein
MVFTLSVPSDFPVVLKFLCEFFRFGVRGLFAQEVVVFDGCSQSFIGVAFTLSDIAAELNDGPEYCSHIQGRAVRFEFITLLYLLEEPIAEYLIPNNLPCDVLKIWEKDLICSITKEFVV